MEQWVADPDNIGCWIKGSRSLIGLCGIWGGVKVSLVPVHSTVLDSSEKVLMSRGLAEDGGTWGSPALDSTGFF